MRRRDLLRIPAFGVGILSLLAALYDVLNVGASVDYRYLWPESLARILMALFALVLTRNAWHQARARLLVVALLGLSLDLYWQTPWAYVPDWARWSAMLVKYAGVSVGLLAFLRFATHLGGARPTRVGTVLNAAAPWIASALFVVGTIHGAFWIASGQAGGTLAPAMYKYSHPTYLGYLALAILVRMAIIVAAVEAAASRSVDRRSTLIVAVSVAFFGLGTILNFGARLPPFHDQGPGWADAIDSLGTLLLVLGLALAGRRRQLPGIEMPALIDRALFAGFQGVLVSCCFVTVEWAANSAVVEGLVGKSSLAEHKDILSLVVALGIAWTLKPAEKWAERFLPPERHGAHPLHTGPKGDQS
jgi:hypothetical protein